MWIVKSKENEERWWVMTLVGDGDNLSIQYLIGNWEFKCGLISINYVGRNKEINIKLLYCIH